jgi:hypothetical protein
MENYSFSNSSAIIAIVTAFCPEGQFPDSFFVKKVPGIREPKALVP